MWFRGRTDSSIRDFFDVGEHSLHEIEASARTVDRTSGVEAGESMAQHVAAAHARLRFARAGDWQPFEHHLRSLGARSSSAGLELSAGCGDVDSFYGAVAARSVTRYCAEPARLTAVLLVLGAYMERSLSLIASGYCTTKQQLESEPSARHLRVIDAALDTEIDISERVQLEQASAATRQALDRTTARLATLSETAHEFAAASGDIELLLELVARRLGEIIGEGCAVRLISHDGAWLEPSSSFFHSEPETRELAKQVLGLERQQLGEGLAGRVAATGVAVLIPVIETSHVVALTAPAFRTMLAEIGVTSALAIPLRSRGRTIGAISLLRSTPGHPYTVEDQHFAQDLADRAGLAIDNAVLVSTLEQRVTERTAALQAANQELESFSYTVSHDLRTPLRAIDGFSQALLSDYVDKLDDRAHHYLARIRSATKRMSGLIDDLLNLARISRVPLELVDHDLSAVAAETASEMQRQNPAGTTQIHVAPGLSVRADVRLMKVVFENLLGNALKFTSKREDAQIWFGGSGGTFFVRDNGAGFDMAYSKRLFVPFQRLHRVDEYEGTGIGLATVHRIIAHHGGSIWAEAEPGNGATFFFTLGHAHG